MKEASPVKHYFAKYFFLAFGVIQWLSAMLLYIQSDDTKGKMAALLFFVLGMTAMGLYFLIASRLKRVVLGKNRITIFSEGKSIHYEWPDVKWIRSLPYVNVYKLKLRGRKGRIYFLLDSQEEPIYGLFQEKPEVAHALRKKVR